MLNALKKGLTGHLRSILNGVLRHARRVLSTRSWRSSRPRCGPSRLSWPASCARRGQLSSSAACEANDLGKKLSGPSEVVKVEPEMSEQEKEPEPKEEESESLVKDFEARKALRGHLFLRPPRDPQLKWRPLGAIGTQLRLRIRCCRTLVVTLPHSARPSMVSHTSLVRWRRWLKT